MEVCAIKVKSPEKKKKNKSDTKEAVRKRLNRLRENPDFKVLLAEELEKASGGGECKQCRGYAQQCNDALKQQLLVVMDWQSDLKKFSLARMDMQASINNMQDSINSLEECDKLNQEIKEDQRRTIIALRQKIAMKHGRKYTGKKRGRPKKLVGADGAPLVAKRPAGSEEEEEEEEE